MRRRVLFIALFLLLGAAINVAVAWGCATQSNARFVVEDAPNHHSYPWEFYSGVGIQIEQFAPQKGSGRIIFHGSVTRVCAGWPMLGLSGVVLDHPLEIRVFFILHRNLRNSDELQGALAELGQSADSGMIVEALNPYTLRDVLPLLPLWPGFAINTLFYAAIAWLAIRGPFALRRIIRVKRGRCIACGYDLRGQAAASDRCPECGSAHAPSPQPSPSGRGGQANARVAQIK